MEVKEITINEAPDFPEDIYKYRTWDGYQKTIIAGRTVFMARPTSFEDKKDCKILKSYDLLTNQYIC